MTSEDATTASSIASRKVAPAARAVVRLAVTESPADDVDRAAQRECLDVFDLTLGRRRR